MRTVEQRNLTLVVWSLRLSNENVQTSLVSRELSAKLLACHVLSLLDNPEVEYLSLNDEVVLVTDLLLDLSNVLAWESWYDAVNECSTNVVVLLEPLLESFVVLTEVFLPQLDVLTDAVLKMVTVKEYKLTRHDDKTLRRITVEGLITTVEQLHELARVRRCRSVRQLA